jgi:hypothetical protein
MDSRIIFVYCLCDDLLKTLGHREDPQCRVSDAEILTVALVAALDFGGRFKSAYQFLHQHGYLPVALSASRFIRRLHRCEPLIAPLFHVLASLAHETNDEALYIIDSFPLPVCDNIRIRRCRRYRGEVWRGYQASKRRYFYGLKIHLMVNARGQPVEFFLSPVRSTTPRRSNSTPSICPKARPSRATRPTTITATRICWPRHTAGWSRCVAATPSVPIHRP